MRNQRLCPPTSRPIAPTNGSKRWTQTVCAALAVLVLAGAFARVSPAESRDSSEEDARARKDELDPIVVTARRHYVATDASSATKTATPLIEIPQSVSVVTHDQLELLQIQNLEQATRYTAGIVSGSYGPDDRFDWLTLRGFTPTQFLDGLALPTAAIAEGQARMDTYGLEQVEILKGPSSALYGQVAPGGLVAMVSKRPSQDLASELHAELGTFSHREVAVDTGGAVDSANAVLYRLTALFRDAGSQTDFVHNRRYFVAPALTWKISPSATLTLLSHYQYDRTGTEGQFLPSQGTRLPNPFGVIPTSRFIGEPGFDSYRRREWDAGYDFDYRPGNQWYFHQNLRYTSLNVNYDSMYAYNLEPDLRTLDRLTYVLHSAPYNFTVDSQIGFKAGSDRIRHDLIFGIDYHRAFDDSALGFGVGPSIDAYAPVYGQPITVPAISSQNIIKQDQLGIYVQDHEKIDRFAITLSGRQDWVSTRSRDAIANTSSTQRDPALTGRLGVDYLIDSGFAPYASYSRSFLPTLGSAFNGSPFRPTTGVGYEVGVKYQPPTSHIFVTADVYRINQRNALTPDVDPAHLGFSVQTGEVRSQGFEIEGTARLHDNLSLNVSYAHTDAKTIQSNGADFGKQVALVPRDQASAFVDYTIRSGQFTGVGVGAGVRYVGTSFGDPTNQVEGSPYTLVDAILHYDMAHWRLSLNANNLLDKIYIPSCYSLDGCVYGSRRTVIAGGSYRW